MLPLIVSHSLVNYNYLLLLLLLLFLGILQDQLSLINYLLHSIDYFNCSDSNVSVVLVQMASIG